MGIKDQNKVTYVTLILAVPNSATLNYFVFIYIVTRSSRDISQKIEQNCSCEVFTI